LICLAGCADTATQFNNSTNQFFRFLGKTSDAATGKTAPPRPPCEWKILTSPTSAVKESTIW
jgi:hypothetical protein